jgi:uncharacterized protein YfaS (alpha-2-macroglobulin family)
VSQLRARQSAEGGFALWPGNGPDEFATVYALKLLLEAKDRKLAVPQDMIAKANLWLQGRLGGGESMGWGWRNRTEMAWLLTRQGILVPAALANLRTGLDAARATDKGKGSSYNRKLETDLGAAYLAASFQLLKQDAVAQALMQPVWDDFLARTKTKTRRAVWDYYYDPLVHDTTLILLAARHFPQKLQAMPVDTWSRLAEMIGDGWYSTQSSASTILAVDAYARAAAASAKGQLNASAVDKAGKLAPLPLVGDLRVLMQAAVPLGTARLKLANPGELPLFYGWAEAGYERNLPETAIVQGLEITQVILNDKGVAVSEVKIGDDVTVRLTVRAVDRDAVRQVALVNILPSGLEPVVQPTTGDEIDTETPIWRRRLGGAGSWSLTYADMREDRVIFFGDVSTRTQEVSFKARATNVGQFAMPAAFGEAMYERRVFGRSAAGRFTVAPLGK